MQSCPALKVTAQILSNAPLHGVRKAVAQALKSIPRERAEWILWLDMDMVLENITFSLPLESYVGKDFILWGQPEWIMKGHNAKGGSLRVQPHFEHHLLHDRSSPSVADSCASQCWQTLGVLRTMLFRCSFSMELACIW